MIFSRFVKRAIVILSINIYIFYLKIQDIFFLTFQIHSHIIKCEFCRCVLCSDCNVNKQKDCANSSEPYHGNMNIFNNIIIYNFNLIALSLLLCRECMEQCHEGVRRCSRCDTKTKYSIYNILLNYVFIHLIFGKLTKDKYMPLVQKNLLQILYN